MDPNQGNSNDQTNQGGMTGGMGDQTQAPVADTSMGGTPTTGDQATSMGGAGTAATPVEPAQPMGSMDTGMVGMGTATLDPTAPAAQDTGVVTPPMGEQPVADSGTTGDSNSGQS